jgi:uncharacterized membrane protein YjdF
MSLLSGLSVITDILQNESIYLLTVLSVSQWIYYLGPKYLSRDAPDKVSRMIYVGWVDYSRTSYDVAFDQGHYPRTTCARVLSVKHWTARDYVQVD